MKINNPSKPEEEEEEEDPSMNAELLAILIEELRMGRRNLSALRSVRRDSEETFFSLLTEEVVNLEYLYEHFYPLCKQGYEERDLLFVLIGVLGDARLREDYLCLFLPNLHLYSLRFFELYLPEEPFLPTIFSSSSDRQVLIYQYLYGGRITLVAFDRTTDQNLGYLLMAHTKELEDSPFHEVPSASQLILANSFYVIYLKAQVERQGYGTRLLRAAGEYAYQQGATHLFLERDPSLTLFYQRRGFRPSSLSSDIVVASLPLPHLEKNNQ